MIFVEAIDETISLIEHLLPGRKIETSLKQSELNMKGKESVMSWFVLFQKITVLVDWEKNFVEFEKNK